MKKWFSLLLVVSLILAACGSAAAEEPQVWYQCGPYRYILLEDGAAQIEKYSGEEATVIIPAELDGKKVTAVGENAFVPENPWDTTSWQGPQSVVIPEGVTKIGNGAFSYCGNLKSVTIPESVVSIGDLVLFYSGGTVGLSLTIPDGLVYLGSCTHPDFSDEQIRKLENHPCLEVKDGMLFSKQDSRLICCLFPDQVTHADIPEGTRIIGDYAFAYSNLESVTIPDTVTAIGSYAFYSSALQRIEIPGSVASVGDYAFAGCQLTETAISEGLVSLGDYALSDNGDLTRIVLPDSLVEFGNDPFLRTGYRSETGIPEIVFSASHPCLEIVDNMLFNKQNHQLIKNLKTEPEKLYIPEGTEIIGGMAFKGRALRKGFTIPETVAEIREQAFAESYDPEMLAYINYMAEPIGKLPASLKVIGPRAFYGAWLADFVSIPDSVESLGEEAFRGSTLSAVIVPGNVRTIPRLAFGECRKLSDVVLLDGITQIEERAFYADQLSRLVLPDSIVYIGDEAFRNGSLGSGLVLPENLAYIGSWALDADGLETLTIPDSVSAVGVHPFSAHTVLQVSPDHPYFSVVNGAFIKKKSGRLISVSAAAEGEYTVPAGVRSVGDYAFRQCLGITSVVIPEGVTDIGSYAFAMDRCLADIVLPSSLKTIGSNAFSDTSLKDVVIPEGTVSIGDQAFAGCRALESVTIPEGTVSIGDLAFATCRTLETVVIPESVSFIGEDAFYRCKNLILTVVPGSYAEKYCKENGLNCVNP